MISEHHSVCSEIVLLKSFEPPFIPLYFTSKESKVLVI